MYLLPHGNNNMFTDLLLTHKTFVNATTNFISMESYSPDTTVWNIIYRYIYIFIKKITLYTSKENQLGMEE